MSCVNKPTIEQLNRIKTERECELKKANQEIERVALAISLDVCPCCGAPIVDEPVEVYDKPKKYLFGLIKIKKKTWGYRKICSKRKTHYEDKGYFDYTDCMY